MMRNIFTIGFLLILNCLDYGEAAPVKTEEVEAELVTEVELVQPGRPFWVAVRFAMAPGWHIYWKNPGDSGMATSVEWEEVSGVKIQEIQWPAPERIRVSPSLVNFGYGGKVLLLTEIHPANSLDAGKPLSLTAQVQWVACQEICVPGQGEVTVALPVKRETPQVNSKWGKEFERTRGLLPIPLTSEVFQLTATQGQEKFILKMIPGKLISSQVTGSYFFPEDRGMVDYDAEQLFRQIPEGYELIIKRSSAADRFPDSLKGVLLIEEINQKRVFSMNVPLKG